MSCNANLSQEFIFEFKTKFSVIAKLLVACTRRAGGQIPILADHSGEMSTFVGHSGEMSHSPAPYIVSNSIQGNWKTCPPPTFNVLRTTFHITKRKVWSHRKYNQLDEILEQINEWQCFKLCLYFWQIKDVTHSIWKSFNWWYQIDIIIVIHFTQ